MYDLGLTRLKRPQRTWMKSRKDLNYAEGRKMYGINPFDDLDRDGVANWKDCRPFDFTRQDVPAVPNSGLPVERSTSIVPYQPQTPSTRVLPRFEYGDETEQPQQKNMGWLSVDSAESVQQPLDTQTPKYTSGVYIYALYKAEESGYARDQWVNIGNFSIEEVPAKVEELKSYPYIEQVLVDKRPNYESFLNKKLFAGQVYQGVKTGAKAVWGAARQYSNEQGFRQNVEEGTLPLPEAASWYQRARSRITGSGGEWTDTMGNVRGQQRPPVSRDITMGSRAWAQQPSQGMMYDPFAQSYQQTPKQSMQRQRPIGSSIIPPRPEVGRIQPPQRLPQQRTIQGPQTIQSMPVQRPQQPQRDFQLSYDEEPILYRRSISDQAADLSTSPEWRDPNREPNPHSFKPFPPVDTPSIYNSTSPFARPDRKLPSAGIPGTTVQRYSPVTADQAILHKPLVGAPNVAQFGTPRGSRGFGLTNPREYWQLPDGPRGLSSGRRISRPGGILTPRNPNQPYQFQLAQI